MNKLKVLKRKEDTFVQRQISYGQDAIILSCAHRLGKKKKKRKIGGVHGSSQSLCKIGSFYYRG